ncbi:MAG: trypsin-like peptidase domain-containing protein [Planctomycetia bacterium]|nr:trypsin-like peptidase domain-containing protein [Planctomycetia bacterium]
MSKFHFTAISVFFLLAFVLIGTISADPGKIIEQNARDQAKALSIAFRKTSRKVIPAVVKIVVHREKKKETAAPLFDPEDSFLPEEEDIEGIGSGVLLDPQGKILTNYHVVSDRKNITVELYDGRLFDVQSVHKDQKSDLALLKISSKSPLPYLKFANSDQLEIGDWVLAIGNPFMLDSSVSAGIISAKKRRLGKNEHGIYIQTDAAVNPGNSGGPLVNLDGDIVGINTAIASLSGGNQGIGFAIPSNTARWILNQLSTKGSVERAFLGAQVQPLSFQDQKKYELSSRRGVRITTPYEKSPAALAGLRRNDVLLAFDDIAIDSPEALESMIESADIQKDHHLTLYRNGEKKKLTLPIKLQVLPDNYVGVPVVEKIVENGSFFKDAKFGLMIIPLTANSVRTLDVKAKNGVLVLSAIPTGKASRAGIRNGMIITAINDKEITSPSDYRAQIEKLPESKETAFTVITREGQKVFKVK